MRPCTVDPVCHGLTTLCCQGAASARYRDWHHLPRGGTLHLAGRWMAFTHGLPIASPTRLRLRYLALAVATIALGLLFQQTRDALPFAFADALGDALWALMMYWLVGVAYATPRRLPRAAVALVLCWLVEFSQLYHTPWLDRHRATTLGHLILGSGFDLRDLASYGIGVLVGLRLEMVLAHRLLHPNPDQPAA